MDKKKLMKTFDDIKPTSQQKERMLNNILKQASEDEVYDELDRKRRREVWKINRAIAAACFVFVIAAGLFVVPNIDRGGNVEPPIMDEPIYDEGMRQFMNYNGNRYEFLNGGETFDLSDRVGENLGKLEHQISFTMTPEKSNADKDFATTLALGGEVIKIKDVDTFFRVGVRMGNQYYICQNVGSVVGSNLDIKEYFERARFNDRTKEIIVFEKEKKKSVKGENMKMIIEDISKSEEIEISNEDYEKIGIEIGEGRGVRIYLKLEDDTLFKMTYLKSLNLISIGDSYYKIENLRI